MYRRKNGILEKKCAKCENWFPLVKFDRKGNTYQSYCKDCVKQHNSTKNSKADWTSSRKWLDEYAKKYNREHPIDEWQFEKLYHRKTVWDGIPAALMVKELR